MPEISRFYGLIIYMFFNDHNPPHFKVKYGDFEANILISNGTILNGDLPISKLKLVTAWAEIHKNNYKKCGIQKNFKRFNLCNNEKNSENSNEKTLPIDLSFQ